MFYDSKSFRAVESALSATWLQQQISLQNLANQETPGYKSKSLVFEDVLNKSMQTNPKSPYDFEGSILTDTSTSLRPDGNNVDTDAESMVLYKAYAQYSYLTQKISGEFNNVRYVLTNAMK